MAQDGNTALLMAAKHGHADVLKLLLEAGADANIENRYPDIVELLLQAGANKDHKDSVSVQSPLFNFSKV